MWLTHVTGGDIRDQTDLRRWVRQMDLGRVTDDRQHRTAASGGLGHRHGDKGGVTSAMPKNDIQAEVVRPEPLLGAIEPANDPDGRDQIVVRAAAREGGGELVREIAKQCVDLYGLHAAQFRGERDCHLGMCGVALARVQLERSDLQGGGHANRNPT